MMMVCPQCGGYGVATFDSEEHCAHCKGWGLLLSREQVCPSCKGKASAPMWCSMCANKGMIGVVTPLHGSVKGATGETVDAPSIYVVEGADLREALTVMRIGYEGTEPVTPKALGVFATLVGLSAEFDGHPITGWLQDDRIVVEPSGIWVVRGEQACRIHEFEVTHV